MSEQRTLQHALIELHHAEALAARRLGIIDILLSRLAREQAETTRLRALVTTPQDKAPGTRPGKADQGV